MTDAPKVTYRVHEWERVFENAGSRKVGSLSWVKVPNRHDSAGYRRLIAMKAGVSLYGAWVLIVQVASKMPRRGVLANENGPLDADDLAARTGAPAKVFDRAFSVLTDPKIGWLEAVATNAVGQAGSTLPDRPDALSPEQSRGEERRKEKRRDGSFAKRGFQGGADDLHDADLVNAERLNERYELRVNAGLIGRGEADRLDYFSLAAKANRVGTKNKAGMFAEAERNFERERARIPARDEETARRMLNGRLVEVVE